MNVRAPVAAVFAALMVACGTALAAIPIQHWTQPGGAQVYFVTVYEPSLAAHQSEVNGTLDAGVARYSNAHLIDWDSVAAGAVCSDGIHISCGGAPTYVNLILASI